MNKQINKQMLMKELSIWNSFLRKKVHLIACGGTAKYDNNPEKMMDNFRYFKEKILERGYYEEK